MDVYGCDKSGCENRNNKCDRYSAIHGYICDECFQELLNYPASISIYDFMRLRKTHHKHKTRLEKIGAEFPVKP